MDVLHWWTCQASAIPWWLLVWSVLCWSSCGGPVLSLVAVRLCRYVSLCHRHLVCSRLETRETESFAPNWPEV